MIVATFLIFIAIPEITVFFIAKASEDRFTIIWIRLIYAIDNINFCIDPLIYVFGCQPVKVAFKRMISKLFPCERNSLSDHSLCNVSTVPTARVKNQVEITTCPHNAKLWRH